MRVPSLPVMPAMAIVETDILTFGVVVEDEKIDVERVFLSRKGPVHDLTRSIYSSSSVEQVENRFVSM